MSYVHNPCVFHEVAVRFEVQHVSRYCIQYLRKMNLHLNAF